MRLTLAKQIEVGPIEDVNKATHDPSVYRRIGALGWRRTSSGRTASTSFSAPAQVTRLASRQQTRCHYYSGRLRRRGNELRHLTVVADCKKYRGKPGVPRLDLSGWPSGAPTKG